MLGDGDQQQVEEVALVLGGPLAGEQEVEVLGEGHRPIRSCEIVATDLDPVGIGLADAADGGSGLTDRHGTAGAAKLGAGGPAVNAGIAPRPLASRAVRA